MFKRVFKIIAVIAVIVATGVTVGAYVLWQDMQTALDKPIEITKSEIYQLQRGTNVRTLSKAMAQNGWVQEALFFEIEARRQKLANHLKAGSYEINPGDTPRGLLGKFADGETAKFFISFIEGMTLKQVLAVTSANPLLLQTLGELNESEIIEAISPADKESLEGWIFPSTYQFEAHTTDLDILKRAHTKMKEVLAFHWETRAADLPYDSPIEALTMASIVEKETGQAAERKEIAGVFVRRLNKGMKLQTDPTVIYGMGDSFDGNLRRKDLRQDTPYNTYTRYGLPPTPIAMPGEASIEAALHPAPGESFYFVAKGDGWHQFSNTLKAHNAAVRKYQLKK
jgi:UPF0755 protein